MDKNELVKELRQNLTIIQNEYTYASYEEDHGRCSFYQILYMMDQQNKLLEKIINYIEKNV